MNIINKDKIFCIIVLFNIFILVEGDREYVFHENEDSHISNYDKNVFEGSLKLNKNSLKNLEDQFISADENQDGFLDKKEMSNVIHAYYKKQDIDEAASKLKEFDVNKDGFISWQEYLKLVYGHDNLDDLKSDFSEENVQYLKIIEEDEELFKAANYKAKSQGDVLLDLEEFSSFLNPSRYPHMRSSELSVTLTRLDRDKDGFISFEEYLAGAVLSKENEAIEHESFSIYDKDKDNLLNRDELEQWAYPEEDSLAEQEASRLIGLMDANEDGKLSLEEVRAQYSVWEGSPMKHHSPKKHDVSEL